MCEVLVKKGRKLVRAKGDDLPMQPRIKAEQRLVVERGENHEMKSPAGKRGFSRPTSRELLALGRLTSRQAAMLRF
jgi:hypothetical protein